jgi:hypothetical protein
VKSICGLAGLLTVSALWAGLLSRVENNTFISPDNPTMRVKIGWKFEYVGSVPFIIGNTGGNRYVFVHATRDKHIDQMFIIQQERPE